MSATAPGAARGSPGARAAGALVALLTVLAAVLRWRHLGSQSLWYDESLTAQEAAMPFGHMLSSVLSVEVTPPLYFTAAWAWGHLFGAGAQALRSLSAVAGTATVPVAYLCGAATAGRRTGIVAAGVVATNPLLVWYSQEARSYALFVLAGVTATTFFLIAAGPGRSAIAPLRRWALAGSVALLTHYFAMFVVMPQAAWLLARRRDRRTAAACGAVTAVWAATLPLVLGSRGGARWIARIPLPVRLEQIATQAPIGFAAPAWIRGSAIVLVLAGLALLAAGGRRPAASLGVLALVAVALPLALAAIGLDYANTRNLLLALTVALIAAAAGLASPRARRAGLLAAVALCGLGAGQALATSSAPSLQRPAWSAVARALGHARGPRVILVAGAYRGVPLVLYLPRASLMPRRPRVVTEVDLVGTRHAGGDWCWWGARCQLTTAWPRRSPPHLRAFARRRVGPFAVVRLSAPRPLRLAACAPALAALARFRGPAPSPALALYQPGARHGLVVGPSRCAPRRRAVPAQRILTGS